MLAFHLSHDTNYVAMAFDARTVSFLTNFRTVLFHLDF